MWQLEGVVDQCRVWKNCYCCEPSGGSRLVSLVLGQMVLHPQMMAKVDGNPRIVEEAVLEVLVEVLVEVLMELIVVMMVVMMIVLLVGRQSSRLHLHPLGT
jgi:hypothetical protein